MVGVAFGWPFHPSFGPFCRPSQGPKGGNRRIRRVASLTPWVPPGCDHRAVSSDSIRIVEGKVGDIERVEPLWRSMVEFHSDLAGGDWPVRPVEAAWELRRAQYREWIGDEGCWLLLAVDTEGATGASGYAVLRLVEPGPTWDLGERIGEIESLAVAPEARGEGIGTALLEAARGLLRERGISYWSVGVVEKNAGATRHYRRHGFRNYYRQLLATVE